jgi:hypothetical protein
MTPGAILSMTTRVDEEKAFSHDDRRDMTLLQGKSYITRKEA